MVIRPYALLLLTAAWVAPLPAQAPATPASNRAPHRTHWDLANHTWVKLVPREAGAAPNAHPAQVAPEALASLLGGPRITVEGAEEPLFEATELAGFTKALAEALSLAGPEEDVVLLSAHRRGHGFMSAQLGATARLFVAEGKLNLLVHDTRRDFVVRAMAEGVKPTFRYGSRTEASSASLRTTQGVALRPDWVAFPLAPPAAVAASATGSVATPTVTAPPTGPAPAKTEAWYREREEKLRSLKRLRDENLISEAEFQQKRAEILKDY